MATAPEAAHGGEAVGMPQLNFDTFPSQIFWLLVALVVLYLILTRVALPRITGVIEDRHDAIEDDLDRAAQLRQKASDAEAAYHKALNEARDKAHEIADKTRAEIQKEIDAAIAKADSEIAARTAESEKRIQEIRDSATASVREVAIDTAEAIVVAILHETPDAEAVKTAVASRVGG